MSSLSASISEIAGHALRWSPTAWLHSWLLYLGIETHVRATIDPELKPLHNVCEYLNALHIYTDEARKGICRSVEAYHFCSHVSRDLRQCLLYDSCSTSARLIGVEYMVPKHVYETLDPEEQKLWHSHEFEVKSGMLIMPTPSTHRGYEDKWVKLETEAMKEVIGLYGKTWHFWEVDKGHELPLGWPKLMGSLTGGHQANTEEALRDRNRRLDVDHKDRAKLRQGIEEPGKHPNSDIWWKEAQEKKAGVAFGVEGLQHVQEEAPGTFDPDAEKAWADSCVLQIKNLSPLRSSDRRKLADQIISEFSVAVPSNPAPSADENGENAEPSTSPTLTSIRASLLPENCLSARFTTHAGADAKLVSGTVYVGAHPGHEERILWLQMGQKDQRLYPTVYTLWQNPGLVPLLHTQDLVVDKLRTGADLMTPGLTRGPPFPEKAKKNAVVAVASLTRPSVPAVVGICEIDVSALGSVRGAKGHAVKGVHWDGDEIWAWSQTGTGGRQAPEAIEGWDQDSSPKEVEEGLKHLELEDEEDAQEDGGVTLVDPSEATHNAHVEEDTVEMDGPEADSGQREPSTKEIDEAFQNAFLYAVYDAKMTGSAPHYGLKLPIQPAYLISNMIQPYLPVYHESQAPYYNIKKTSWKNPKRFIKHLDKEKIVKSKDRNGNETIIFDIDFEDQQITHFTPYRLPKPKETTDTGGGQAQVSSKEAVGADTSINQTLTLQILIRPSSKLVPDLLPSKTDLYTPAQVTSFLKTYIENNPELTSQSSSARFVKLDPFLANNILGSNSSPADTKALAAGEIARDVLQKRILDDHNLCVPYWVLLRNGRNWSSSDSSLPKPKSGPSPKVAVVIEKRTGTKTVTKVGNVEVFGINPDLLASDLQKKCASSTSVGQLMGGKPGMMEVLVQGDQREVVEKEMGRRGVDRKWIEVVDKTKKKSGAGSGGGGGGGGRR